MRTRLEETTGVLEVDLTSCFEVAIREASTLEVSMIF